MVYSNPIFGQIALGIPLSQVDRIQPKLITVLDELTVGMGGWSLDGKRLAVNVHRMPEMVPWIIPTLI